MITRQIELYVGRKIDFVDEVQIVNDCDNIYIEKWNITDKKQPDLSKLKPYDEQEYIDEIGIDLTLVERIERIERLEQEVFKNKLK